MRNLNWLLIVVALLSVALGGCSEQASMPAAPSPSDELVVYLGASVTEATVPFGTTAVPYV